MKKVIDKRRSLELLFVLALTVLCDAAGGGKYLLVLAFGLILLFLGRKNRWSLDVVACLAVPALLYLLSGGFGGLIHGTFYENSIKTVLFWMVPLIGATSFYVYFGSRIEKVVDIQFIGSCIAFHLANPLEILFAFHFESIYAFVFGAFLIYYAYRKRWVGMAIAAVFLLRADKRIAMIAVAAAVLIFGLLWLFRYSRKMAMIIWGAIAAAVNFYVFFSYYGTLEYFCKGIGINTNGRLRMYGRVAEWFDNELLVFGQGLGVVEKLLENWNIPAFLNLHNDLLKFYVELGVVGLLVYLFSYGVVIWLTGKRIGKPQMSFLVAMFAYSMALFATDNVSIYIMYTMPFYTMCFAGLSLGENPERMNGKADKSCQ